MTVQNPQLSLFDQVSEIVGNNPSIDDVKNAMFAVITKSTNDSRSITAMAIQNIQYLVKQYMGVK